MKPEEWQLEVLFTQEQLAAGKNLDEALRLDRSQEALNLVLQDVFHQLFYTAHPRAYLEANKCPIWRFCMASNINRTTGSFSQCELITPKLAPLQFVARLTAVKHLHGISLAHLEDPLKGFKSVNQAQA